MRIAMAGLRALIERNDPPVDTDRIYATGLSSGGFGAFDAMKKFPDVFAAAVPISAVWSPELLNPKARNRFWIILNEGEYAPREALVRRLAETARGYGGEVRVSFFQGRDGHDAWNRAYRERAMWEWLFAQSLRQEARPRGAPIDHRVGAIGQGLTARASVPARPGHGPEMVLDGLQGTSFISAGPARRDQWLEIVFPSPTDKGTIRVAIGDHTGKGRDIPAVFEYSTNRARFVRAAEFERGQASWEIDRRILSVRVRILEHGDEPWGVRSVLYLAE